MNWRKSLELLRAGDPAGWPKHEWIPSGNLSKEITANFGLPIWEGQDNVTLLVNADCGMGDTIHFFRWLPKNVKVVLRCDEDFDELLPVETVSKESPIPEVDYVIHMMAIPRLIDIEMCGKPYLSPQGDDPCQQLSKLDFHKVGVCWSGNPFNPRDEARSIPMLKHWWGNTFSLVKHDKEPAGFDMRGFMQNWNTTAHLLGHMDLIISVDTAIAHLGGALGIPTWLLLPKKCDWRWGDEDSTPWYDSIRIFRNKSGVGDLVEEVSIALKESN